MGHSGWKTDYNHYIQVFQTSSYRLALAEDTPKTSDSQLASVDNTETTTGLKEVVNNLQAQLSSLLGKMKGLFWNNES